MAESAKRYMARCEGLPLISAKGLHSVSDREIRATAHAIGDAAREFGFFRLCDHGIEANHIEATYRVAREFFDLPKREKMKCYIGLSSNHRGYVPFSEKGDYPDEANRNYEAFDLGLDLPKNDPDYLAGNGVLGPNVWPDLPGFRDVISDYYAKVSALGRSVCGALEMYLELPPGAMTRHMTKPVSQLRLLHYVRQQAHINHRSVNMGAHTDYECLTLLHTRNSGLQVMTSDDKWIDVPVDPGVLVVNIGDMLEAWSNGILRSTPHRVLNTSPERFSLPYFVAADYHTEIAPFDQLVDHNQSPLYRPFLAGQHLERMLQRDFPYLRAKAQRENSNAATHNQAILNPFEERMNQGLI